MVEFSDNPAIEPVQLHPKMQRTDKAALNGATAPPAAPRKKRGSIFDDVESLKKVTAANINKLKEKTSAASASIILGRPNKKWFFRVPDDDGDMFAGGVWEDPDNRELYYVSPELWEHDQLVGSVRSVLFVPYVTVGSESGASVHGIWPVSTASGNTYTDSLHREILPLARVSWVRIWADTRAKKYRCQPAEDDYGDPSWLPKTIFQQLSEVFPEKMQVLEDDHPLIDDLRGRKRPTASAKDDPNA